MTAIPRDDELRRVRNRQIDLRSAGRRPERSRPNEGAMLVQVYDAGAMGHATGLYYACKPLRLDGALGEAQMGIVSAADAYMLVYVIGTVAPVAGDVLVANLCGGRWVADKYSPSSTTIGQPSCPCNPMPSVMQFAGNYATTFGPANRDPTSLGCPTSTTLTGQARPANFQHSSIVANNTVWMSPAFTYRYYVYNPNTGNFDIIITTTSAFIIYWCQPQNGHITCQIYDAANDYGGANALLAQNGDSSTTQFACSPFLWKYNATTSTWAGRTQLNA